MSDTPVEYCRELVEAEDHERYLMTLFVPSELQPRLWALLAFNVELAKTREQVSEPALGQIRLQWWQDAIDGLAVGEVRDNPVCKALDGVRSHVDKRFWQDIKGIIDARSSDLDDMPFRSTSDMINYARNTSGRLHQIALGMLVSAPDQASHQAAGHVGTAWALTGLVRAMGFQLGMNRLSVPEDVLEAQGIDPNSLFRGSVGDEIWPVIDQLSDLARAEIKEARALRGEVVKPSRPLLALARLAERYVDRFSSRTESPFELLQDNSDLPKIWQLLKANLSGKF